MAGPGRCGRPGRQEGSSTAWEVVDGTALRVPTPQRRRGRRPIGQVGGPGWPAECACRRRGIPTFPGSRGRSRQSAAQCGALAKWGHRCSGARRGGRAAKRRGLRCGGKTPSCSFASPPAHSSRRLPRPALGRLSGHSLVRSLHADAGSLEAELEKLRAQWQHMSSAGPQARLRMNGVQENAALALAQVVADECAV